MKFFLVAMLAQSYEKLFISPYNSEYFYYLCIQQSNI